MGWCNFLYLDVTAVLLQSKTHVPDNKMKLLLLVEEEGQKWETKKTIKMAQIEGIILLIAMYIDL